MTDHLLRPAMHTINLDLPFIYYADSGFRHPQPISVRRVRRADQVRRVRMPWPIASKPEPLPTAVR